MATILIETDLDVISKQRQLVEEALGPDSIYIRMKETLLDLLNAGDIKGAEKAKAIAETITQMSASILNLRSIVGAGAKHVILKTSISFFASMDQSYDPNNNIHLGFLILMDTSSDLVVSHFGWDSEGPGGSCRGSTYVYLRYTSDGHIRVSNPQIDYRCYSKYPWYQQLWLNNVEIYVI